VASTEELSPFAEQVFTDCPWQNCALGVQIWSLHCPASHVLPEPQSVLPER
jgi:hypothetical protein